MITTQEETTMLGAINFNYSLLSAKTLISLDRIKEADIESSSAGMCSLTLTKTINYNSVNDNAYKLTISGLMGGHSGDDIDKERCNAIKLAVKLLKELNYNNICNIKFGKRDNIIPSEGYVVFSSNKDIENLKEIELLSNRYGFELNIDARKPFFPFKENSIIRELLAETYKDLYDKETNVKKVHACMEGGILSNNIDDLDICTIAPTIDNCHSINERVSISSTNRVYDWVKETLIRYNLN